MSGSRGAVRSLDVAVAGCGPAGMAAALLLQRQGHRVTIFERFEAAQPVGSGLMLQPTGLAVLKALDLHDQALAAGARINRLFGQAAPSGRTVLDVRYAALGGGGRFGVGIHRASLFALLHEAVRAAGVPIETGRTVTGSHIADGDRRTLTFEEEATAGPFDLVVDALGSRTALAPPTGRPLAYGALWASLDWRQDGFAGDVLEQRYRAASVMTGVLPIGRRPGSQHEEAAFFWSLREDRLPAWRAGGLAVWKADVERLWPATRALLEQIHSPEQMTFARYSHRSLAAPAQPGLIHIGDAWHSASPQLGQGANMALLDAWALSLALREVGPAQDALAHAVRLRRNHVRLYQAMTALFTPVYQSDSLVLPMIRDTVVGPLSRLWPATLIQAHMVSGTVGDPLRRLDLAT